MGNLSRERAANAATTIRRGCKFRLVALAFFLAAICTASAQVLAPAEIRDPNLRSLQQQYINDLKVVGQDIQALQFKYRFYLSRKLDLDESQQQHDDQRSIRFDRYNGQTVVAVTGNYYAAYPEKIGRRTAGTEYFSECSHADSEVGSAAFPDQPAGTRLRPRNFASRPRKRHGGNGGKAGKPDGIFATKRCS